MLALVMDVGRRLSTCTCKKLGGRAQPSARPGLELQPNKDPNSPKYIIFMYFRAQSRYCLSTWSLRDGGSEAH